MVDLNEKYAIDVLQKHELHTAIYVVEPYIIHLENKNIKFSIKP